MKLRETVVKRYWKSLLCLAALMTWIGAASARTDCYFLVGFGSGHYDRSLTHKFEDKLLDTPYIQGNVDYHSKSHPYQIGGGCQPWRYLAFEIDYFQGLRTEVNTTFKACAEISRYTLCSSSAKMQREMTLEGFEISALGLLHLSERTSLTVRLGALTGVARLTLSFPQLSERVKLSTEERGTILLAGIGIRYRANPDFSLSLEHKRFDGYSRINQVAARWHF